MTTTQQAMPVTKWKKFVNGFWIFCQICLLCSVAAVAFDRGSFEELSQLLYGTGVPLMNSSFADVFVASWLGWLSLFAVLITLLKEWKIRQFRTRIMVNFGLIFPLMMLLMGLISALY